MRGGQPVYLIGVAAELCGIHPQTLRQYEKLGLVRPQRLGAKNRVYSEADIARVRRIQRLTQEMGVNLAGVELILRLLDDMEEQRRDMEEQFREFAHEAERRLVAATQSPQTPMRADRSLLPVPRFRPRRAPLPD